MPDDRPEREKYRRASLREQWGDELRRFLGSTPLVALVVALVGGWLVLQLTRPQVVRVPDLHAGDCLYIRAADADPDLHSGRRAASSSRCSSRARSAPHATHRTATRSPTRGGSRARQARPIPVAAT